jgi:hypothetical protein
MKHSFSTSVTKRDHNNRGIEWTATCGRHEKWTGATYEQVEDSWRRHVYEATGELAEATGDKANRWMPAEVSA